MDQPSATRPDAADRIDRACVRFEAEWKAGGRPAAEAYLAGWDGAERAELLVQLLAVEFHYRRRAGDRPALAEYLGRFPADREAVERAGREHGPVAGSPPDAGTDTVGTTGS